MFLTYINVAHCHHSKIHNNKTFEAQLWGAARILENILFRRKQWSLGLITSELLFADRNC